MGSIHVNKDGKMHVLDDNMIGAQAKEALSLPSDSVLVNSRAEQVADHERLGNKVRDGEAIAAYPNFQYW